MDRNDKSAATAVGSRAWELDTEASMVAAKYAGGVNGRDSDARMERMAAAVARRWRW